MTNDRQDPAAFDPMEWLRDDYSWLGSAEYGSEVEDHPYYGRCTGMQGPSYAQIQLWENSAPSIGSVGSPSASRSSTSSSYPDSSTYNDGRITTSPDDSSSYDRMTRNSRMPQTFGSPDPFIPHQPRRIEPEEMENVSEQPRIGAHECPQGCGARFRRSPDVKRHLKEQHGCGHPDCRDKYFKTKIERDQHEESHGGAVLRFECGSCVLKGSPKRFFRAEKLNGHFKSVHKISSKSALKKKFQCPDCSCYSSSDGGTFFASEADLLLHHQLKHQRAVETVSPRNYQSASLNQTGSQFPVSPNKHYIPQESLPEPKRCMDVLPAESSLDIQTMTSPPESTLVEPIAIPDLCKLMEDAGLPKVVEELHLIDVSAVFIRSSKAIKIRGAQTCKDMERAITLLRAILPTKTEEPLPIPCSVVRDPPRIKKSSSSAGVLTETLPLDPKEDKEAIETWKRYISPQLPQILESLLQKDSSVTLVRQKGDLDIFQPVIRFQSPGQTKKTREVIRAKVDQICSQHKRRRIPIHFSRGKMVPLVSDAQNYQDEPADDEDFPHHLRYYKKPGMGTSIGMTQCGHAATLGGYILIDQQPFMLTVKHLLEGTRDGTKHTFSRQDSNNSLTSPALSDVDYLRALVSNILKELLTAEEETDLRTLLTQDLYKIWRRFQTDLSQPIDAYLLGRLYTYSKQDFIIPYYRRDHAILRHRMDWALYEVRNERQGKNKFRHLVGVDPSFEELANEAHNPYGTGQACEEAREFEGGEPVYYVGNRSGYREGHIEVTFGMFKDSGGCSYEFYIIPTIPAKAEQVQGDSGAWVIGKNDHKLLGLLCDYADGKLLFTPIFEVFQDICKQVGNCHIQVAPIDQNRAMQPCTRIPISRTDGKRSLPKGKLLSKLKLPSPTKPDIKITISPAKSSGSSTLDTSSTLDSSPSRPSSPTPSLTSSVTSFSDDPPSPSISPSNAQSAVLPHELLDPFRKLDLKSETLEMPFASRLDRIEGPSRSVGGDHDCTRLAAQT